MRISDWSSDVCSSDLGGRARSYSMTGGDKSDLAGIFRKTLTAKGLGEVPEEHSERGFYYRSDHFSLAKRGVPMFDVSRSTDRSEERRGGTGCGSTCRYRWSRNQ